MSEEKVQVDCDHDEEGVSEVGRTEMAADSHYYVVKTDHDPSVR